MPSSDVSIGPKRPGVLRRLAALTATLGLLTLGSYAFATDASAFTFDCSKRWVKFYANLDESGTPRTYCISGDTDMSSEPGNVMGPLGDGSPVIYQDDFDSVNGTSGISSMTWHDGPGDYGICLYDATNYTGGYQFGIAQIADTIHFSFDGDYASLNNKISSFKIVVGNLSVCPQ